MGYSFAGDVLKEFYSWKKNDPTMKNYERLINEGKDVWKNANLAAERAGRQMSQILELYAPNRYVTLEEMQEATRAGYKALYDYTARLGGTAQRLTNEAADIHMNVKMPRIDDSRINGLMDQLEEDYAHKSLEDSGVFNKGVGENIGKTGVNDVIDYNSRIQRRAGFIPLMRRKTDGSCCKWCSSMADGKWYKRGEEPADFWRFHVNCTCWIDYKVGKEIDVVSFYKNTNKTKAHKGENRKSTKTSVLDDE